MQIIRENSFSTKKGTFLDRFLQKWRIRKIDKYIKDNTTVCDLGCGSEGNFLSSIHGRIKKGVGLDVGVIKSDIHNVEFKEADLEKELPLEDDLFDVVVALAVIEHVNDYQKVLKESLRILKYGGIILLTTPHPRGKGLLEGLAFFGLIDSNEIKDHKNYFTSNELSDLFKQAGFSGVTIKKFQLGFNNLIIAKK